MSTEKNKILKRAFILVLVIVTTTTFHELIHLLVGRALGIPAKFLNFTSVGIPGNSVNQYPEMHLMLMNGIAPIISIILFGVIPVFLLKKNRQKEPNLWKTILGWSAIFNLPYLGLQMMLAVNTSSPNGSGSDMAAVMGAISASATTRFSISVGGYIFFVLLSMYLGRVLGGSKNLAPQPLNIRSKKLGYSLLVLGFLFVCAGGPLVLAGSQAMGMSLIAFGGFFSFALGSYFLINKNSAYKDFKLNWLNPAIVGTIIMAIIGVLLENDYANFWMIIIPTVLGAGAVVSGVENTKS